MKLNGVELTKKVLASHLEWPGIRSADKLVIDAGIRIAKEYGFHAVYCTHTFWQKYMAEQLEGTGILVAAPFDHPYGMSDNKAKIAMAEAAYANGVRTCDLMPNMGAVENRDYKRLVESYKCVVDAFDDGEVKAFCDCTGPEDIMNMCIDAIVEAGCTHVKSYDAKGVGVPMNRIKNVLKRLEGTNVRLKASGCGKFWTTAVVVGALSAGAEYSSLSNAPQVVDELPLFEEFYSKVFE
jgi:deoxyribose-phosphate aldolase